jgi:hypothetical protein
MVPRSGRPPSLGPDMKGRGFSFQFAAKPGPLLPAVVRCGRCSALVGRFRTTPKSATPPSLEESRTLRV